MVSASTRLINTDGLKAAIAEGVTLSQVAEGLGIDLQASGDQWRGLCPLHDENTPSFYVNDAKGVYHCFGCKAGGDGIDLVERVRHLTFPEALEYLAVEADVEIEDYQRPLTEAEREQEAFRAWCENWLTFSMSDVPPERLDAYTGALFAVKERWYGRVEHAGEPDYFRDKRYLLDGVVLPWRHPSGRLVGWRAREHPGGEKSVFGTPNDFPLGKITEQTLFGVQIAREHIEDGRLIAVEGEYDCMALHAHGIQNVVALGGSTMTNGQMELLESMRIRELVLVLDGDDAGRLAAKSLAERYWAHNVLVRIAVCPDGHDPESVLTDQGDWPFLQLTETAAVALEYLLRIEWAARDRGSLSSKLEFVKWIRENYGSRLRASEESLVLGEVAKWLGIPELEVRDFVRVAGGALCAVDSERVLLGKACRDQPFYVYLRSQLIKEDFFVLKHQRIWDMLADMLIDGRQPDPLMLEDKAKQLGIPAGYTTEMLDLPDTNLEYHREQVADLALRRAARDDAVAFRDQIGDLHQPAELLVADHTHRVTSKALRKTGASQRQLTEQVDHAMDTLHERMRNPDDVHGLRLGTQYPQLDRTLQGIQARRLVLISALSTVGKSTMLITWATALGVHQSIPVDIVSLEMDELELLYKIASHMTGIDSLKITGGSLLEPEAKAVERAMLRIRNSGLRVWCPDGMTSTEFLLYARESVMQRRTQVFFVDYVQLIDPENGQERESGYKLYGDFGRMAKMKVARAMDVAVVCAAQLRRDAANKEKPTPEDMGDSYALVRHSDGILILNAKEDSSTLELWVGKNRQGAGGGLVPLVYDKPSQTFYEASGGAKRPEYEIPV